MPDKQAVNRRNILQTTQQHVTAEERTLSCCCCNTHPILASHSAGPYTSYKAAKGSLFYVTTV